MKVMEPDSNLELIKFRTFPTLVCSARHLLFLPREVMIIIGKLTLGIFEGADDGIGLFKPTESGRFGTIGMFTREKTAFPTQTGKRQNRLGVGNVPSEFRTKHVMW